jgi:hypothetical protein
VPHRGDRQIDPDQPLDRLRNLRVIVPVFAEELASARRQAAQLRLENGRLVEQVRRLQHQRIGQDRTRGREIASAVARWMRGWRRPTIIGLTSNM